MVSVQASWPMTSVTKSSAHLSKSLWHRIDTSPPSYHRSPPDGHESPHRFEDSSKRIARVSTDTYCSSNGARARTILHSTSSPSPQHSPASIGSRHLKSDKKEPLSDVRLTPRSMRSGVSVRDRIALFSSHSVEHLSSAGGLSTFSHQSAIEKRNSLNVESCSAHRQSVGRQQRSKSDLKLEHVRIAKPQLPGVHSHNLYGGSLSHIPSNSNSVHGWRSVSFPEKATRNVISPLPFKSSAVRNLSERSQSLLQLYSGDKSAAVSDSNETINSSFGLSQRKSYLNVINEERRTSVAKAEVLTSFNSSVISDTPNQSESSEFNNDGHSNDCSASRHAKGTRFSSNDKKTGQPIYSKIRMISPPPWKNNTDIFPKYSPVFKRKNISFCSLSGSLSTFPPNSTGSSPSTIGGSNQDVSRTDGKSSYESRKIQTRETLQRSSSLNCQKATSHERIYRKCSDDTLTSNRDYSFNAIEDIAGSTQTLVAEPIKNTKKQGSVDISTMRTKNSAQSNVDVSSNTRHSHDSNRLCHNEKSTSLLSIKRKLSLPTSVSVQSTEGNEKTSPNSSRILHDTAWLKSVQVQKTVQPAETGDLLRLKRVKKPSVKVLTEKWQQLSDSSDGSRSPQTSPAAELEGRIVSPDKLNESQFSHQMFAQHKRSINNSNDKTILDASLSDPSCRKSVEKKISLPDFSSESKRLPSTKICSGLESMRQSDRLVSSFDDYLSSMNEFSGNMAFDEPELSRPARAIRATESFTSENLNDTGDSSSLLRMLATDYVDSGHLSDSAPMLRSSIGGQEKFHICRSTEPRSLTTTTSSHVRMSSIDSSASDDSVFCNTETDAGGMSTLITTNNNNNGSIMSLNSGAHGSMTSLFSGPKDLYGSISSLASSTSLISPHELQLLIDDANQSLEEAGTPSHEIIVAVLHRELLAGSVGITLAGGADHNNREISVNKVLRGSVAEKDGRIKMGDRVLSINGKSMKGLLHVEALKILKAPRTEVVLVLSRARAATPLDFSGADASGSGTLEDNMAVMSAILNYGGGSGSGGGGGGGGISYSRAAYLSQGSLRPPKIAESPGDSADNSSDARFVDVPRSAPTTIVLTKEGAGVGFSLHGGKDSPVGDRPLVVKKVFQGGTAEKSGLLTVGDQIVTINDHSVANMARIEAWNFLKKQPDGLLRLKIRKQLLDSPENEDLTTNTNVDSTN